MESDTMKEDIEFLQRVDIFSSLSIDEISQVQELLHNIDCEKDGVLFNEGDAGSELYIVAEGLAASSVKLPDGTLIN